MTVPSFESSSATGMPPGPGLEPKPLIEPSSVQITTRQPRRNRFDILPGEDRANDKSRTLRAPIHITRLHHQVAAVVVRNTRPASRCAKQAPGTDENPVRAAPYGGEPWHQLQAGLRAMARVRMAGSHGEGLAGHRSSRHG